MTPAFLLCLVSGILFLLAFRPSSQEPTPEPSPSPPLEDVTVEWDYLALGDTRTAVGDWPARYASHLETDLGVQVEIQNWGSGSQTSDALLREIIENDSLRFAIRHAEIVTIWTGGHTAREALTKALADCPVSQVYAFGRDLDRIISIILGLREPDTVIIRLLEFYQPEVRVLDDLGLLEEKTRCLTAYNEQIHRIGSRYNVPIAPVYQAFNGLDGNEDPQESGYLKNIIHFSTEGDEVIAGLLRYLGYEPSGVNFQYALLDG